MSVKPPGTCPQAVSRRTLPSNVVRNLEPGAIVRECGGVRGLRTCIAALVVVSAVVLLAGCVPGTWFHPANPTIDVRASGHCPANKGAAADVVANSDGSSTLLPDKSAPGAALVCFYGSRPRATRTVAGHDKLAYAIRLDREEARALAASANKVDLAAPPAGAVNCPMDTGAVIIIAFAYPDAPDVDLWWKSDGCQTIDNGRLGASQLANSSFGAFQQVFKGLTTR